MPHLRHKILRHVVLPVAAAASRTRFLEHYRQMRELDEAPRARRLEVQRERMTALLARLDEVPRWKSLLGQNGARSASDPVDRLRALPVLEKAHLRGAFAEMVPDGVARDGWQFTNSSGTTDRITVVHDFARRDLLRASQMRANRFAIGLEVGTRSVEIPPDACNILCGVEDPGPPEFRAYFVHALRRGELLQPKTLTNLRGRFERRVMYGQTTLLPIDAATDEEFLRAIDERLDDAMRCDPMVLRGLPHFLLWMAERAAQRGLELPSLEVMIPFGGLMSPVMAARCERALGVPFRDLYGTSELGVVAVACEHQRLHVFEDLYHLEVVDQDDRPVAPGAIGDLLVTDLTNHVMPLVRYRVGDLGSLSEEPCPCGREDQTLVVHGRSVELLRRDGVEALAPRELCDLVFDDPDVWNFRLDQRAADGFELGLVAAPFADREPDGERLAEAIAQRLGLRRPPRVRMRPYIRPEGSGKYRACVPKSATAPSLADRGVG